LKWRESPDTAGALFAARARLWDGILTAVNAERAGDKMPRPKSCLNQSALTGRDS
jgi:hypothetical protein